MENKNVEKKEEIVVVGKYSPAAMIQSAITGGADLEKLEKLMGLQERWEANEAKKAYNSAMARFKENPPIIVKDREVAYGNTKYNHATLANVTTQISKALSACGLSASWSVAQTEKTISVTCAITHVCGHSESTTMTAPSDTSGSKNAIQAIGSTITYLERYTILALTGLAAQDQDDDARSAVEVEYLTKSELNTVIDTLSDLDVDVDKFLKFLKVDSLEAIPRSQYAQAMAALEAKRKAKK